MSLQLGKLGAALCAVAMLSGCAERLDWRQVLTVVVNTPSGALEFSAVQAVSLETTSDAYDRFVAGIAGPDGYTYHITGQAPYVRLSDGQILVALMMSNGSAGSAPGRMALAYLGDPEIKGPENDEVARDLFAAQPTGEAVRIPEPDWPYFVLLPEDGDIGAMRAVNGKAGQPLDALIGPGVEIAEVRLAKTDAPVPAPDIAQVIPCLSKQTEACDFGGLVPAMRITRYAMGPQSFLREAGS